MRAYSIPPRRRWLAAAGAAGVALALPAWPASRPAQATPTSPTEDLMSEHGVLSRLLLVYEESARRLGSSDLAPSGDVLGEAAGVVRSFIEDHHQRLEEDYVFPHFSHSAHADLVAVLKQQHAVGRKLTDRILELSQPRSFRQTLDRAQLKNALTDFIHMARPHLSREESVLFPALRETLSAADYRALGDQFRKAEDKLVDASSIETVVERISSLEREVGVFDLAKFTPKT